jgi:hypothetical protein
MFNRDNINLRLGAFDADDIDIIEAAFHELSREETDDDKLICHLSNCLNDHMSVGELVQAAVNAGWR